MRHELARLDEVEMKSAMATVGYRRLQRYVYRAEWSTPEVEHFIYFLLYGKPKNYLAADFGVRNKDAQAFALRSIRKYGGELYQLMRFDRAFHAPMRFPLGQVASWGARASLKISAMSVASLAERIASDIKLHLFVFIRDVTTLDRLLSFLLLDAEPCPWVRSNGAIRAAMIVYLAGRLDMRPSDIVSLLRPHKRSIASALIKAPDPDPDSYVKKVLNDSTRTLASLN